MENYIDTLWESYQTQEVQLLQNMHQDLHADELLLMARKKMMELKLFLLANEGKNPDGPSAFLFRQAPLFCGAYIFAVRLHHLLCMEDKMPVNTFRGIKSEIRRSMEDYCLCHFSFVSNSGSLAQLGVFPASADWDPGLDRSGNIEAECFLREGDLFHNCSIALGRFQAYGKLIPLLTRKKSILHKLISTHAEHAKTQGEPGQLFWTDSGMSLTEIAYALRYAGVINKGNVEVKEIADALAKVFNLPPVNIYRNKQDLYSRKNQTMFLDKLRKDLIRGMEDSDR